MDAESSTKQTIPGQEKDLAISAVIGFLAAILILPIIKQSGFKFSFYPYLSVFLGFPILSVLSILFASVFARKIEFVYQAAKFVLVGVLNTLVDWGVLNLLLILVAVSSGPLYPLCKGVSFVLAATNSYFWNRYWTFKKTSGPKDSGEAKGKRAELFKFSSVSLIGFALNVSVASLIVNLWGPHFHIHAKAWATAGALAGTLVGLVWNFTGYKLVVFGEFNWKTNKILKVIGLVFLLGFLTSLLF